MTRPQYRLALVAASRQGHYLEQADLSGFLAVFARKAALWTTCMAFATSRMACTYDMFQTLWSA